MSLYMDRIYPYLVSRMGDPRPIREIRKRIIPLAQGAVLESEQVQVPTLRTTIRCASPSSTLLSPTPG